ncbi:MAG: HIT domain-containing protein [Candidatus Marsarchaeota archaeon]|nr:HIT domain-containing protein [Candidatus Marsarchaeota archaeon]MCL5412895.1 HIT domain-containing protein [Candidatus Marsarchaeota archaeon]
MLASAKKHNKKEDPFCNEGIRHVQSCAETNSFLILYNAKALTSGHSLIITKDHKDGLLDLTQDEAQELFALIKRALPILLNVYGGGENAYDLKIRSGISSGRTVGHFHVHLIPRKKIDGEYERIYKENLEHPDRPFLDDISEDVEKLRRKFGDGYPADSKNAGNCNVPDAAELEQRLLNNVFYSSEHFLALYHPDPVIDGHTLLVPRRNVTDLLVLSEEEIADMINTYSIVMRMLLKKYGHGSRSYITSLQTGGYENSPTDRLHIHLIPRSQSDRYSKGDTHDKMYYDIYESREADRVIDSAHMSCDIEDLRKSAKEIRRKC